MKSWDLSSRVVSQFYPSLLPVHGYVLHQDFASWYTPWIHLISYRLRDYLVPAVDIARSESVVFRLVQPLPPDLDLTRASLDEHEIELAFAHSLAITRPEKHSGIRAASVMMAHHDGDTARGLRTAQSLAERGLLNEYHTCILATNPEVALSQLSADRDDAFRPAQQPPRSA
jgi:hypothetical protein